MSDVPEAKFALPALLEEFRNIPTVEQALGLNGSSKKPPYIDCVAMAEPLPEIPYLVRELGLVGGGGAPDLVAGFGFSGKTLALQAMLLSMAAERGVWGPWTAPRNLRVIHVDLEQGKRLTTRRYQRLAAGLGIDLAARSDRLVLVSESPLKSFSDEPQWIQLMEGRHLMVIDSLRALTSGTDENDSRMRDVLDWLGSLSQKTNCRVIIIHHARKPNSEGGEARYSIRGTGAIYDAVDGAWVFSAAKGEPVKVEHVKARSHGDLIEDFSLQISDVPLHDPDEPKGGLRVSVFGRELVDEIRAKKAADLEALKAERLVARVLMIVETQPGIGVKALRQLTGYNGLTWALMLKYVGARLTFVDEIRDGRHTSAVYKGQSGL